MSMDIGDNAFVSKDRHSTNRLVVEFYYYKSTRENYWNVTSKKKKNAVSLSKEIFLEEKQIERK